MSSSSKGESQTYRDSRGVCRGRCKECITCDGYQPKESGSRRSFPCLSCDCPPARHVKIDPENDEVTAITARAAGLSINGNGHMKQLIYPPCKLCENEVHFDLNKGEIFDFCKLHLDHQQVAKLLANLHHTLLTAYYSCLTQRCRDFLFHLHKARSHLNSVLSQSAPMLDMWTTVVLSMSAVVLHTPWSSLGGRLFKVSAY